MSGGELHDAVARLVVAVMIADGRVTAGEIDVVARLDHAGLGPLSWRVHQALERLVLEPLDVRAACVTVRTAGRTLVAAVLSMLGRVAGGNWGASAAEVERFMGIANELGVRGEEARRHLGPLRRDPAATMHPGGRPHVDGTEAALRQLGLACGASRAEIEAAYLSLVERYDPGKLAPLGADFVKLAVRELAALTESFERAHAAVRA
jgi:DnaJ-domain-containing protein 1